LKNIIQSTDHLIYLAKPYQQPLKSILKWDALSEMILSGFPFLAMNLLKQFKNVKALKSKAYSKSKAFLVY